MPPQLRAWLSDYKAVVWAIADGLIPASALNPELKGEPVAPMLTTKWNQDSPFNNFVQRIGGSGTPTGCVATAAAQIMKYFNFPERGKGAVLCPDDNYGGQTMDISGHVYDWDNMLDGYNRGYSDEQASAVATLMRDFGYASEIVYKSSTSSG